MWNSIIAFLSYFSLAVVLLIAFISVYIRITPYREFELISQNNTAVAIALAGAVIGFSVPLVASIYYTRSLIEMVVWAAITCVVQLIVFVVLRKNAKRVEQGDVASAVMLAAFSIAIGLLNAVSISH